MTLSQKFFTIIGFRYVRYTSILLLKNNYLYIECHRTGPRLTVLLIFQHFNKQQLHFTGDVIFYYNY